MGKRRGYKMTNAEAAKCKFNAPCPSCESQRTFVVELSFGGYHGCHECNKVWGWHDKRGSSVSRAQYEERAEKAANDWRTRSARGWVLDAPGEESDMTKAKKAAKKPVAKKKAAKKKAAKKDDAERKTYASVIRAELEKNPAASTEAVLTVVNRVCPNPAKPRRALDVRLYREELGIKDPAEKKPVAERKTASKE